MEVAKWLFVVVFWLIFGSFWSVVLLRLWKIPTWKVLKWFLFGHSECPLCHHQLSAIDLIPLFSFLFQGGKCRYCHKKISFLYPFLEMGTVLIFFMTFLMFCPSWFENLFETLFLSLIFRLCFLIAVYDFLYYELHLIATVGVFCLSLCLCFVKWGSFLDFFYGSLFFFWMYLFIYFFSYLFCFLKYREKKEGFWFWDVLFALSIGGIFPLYLERSGLFQWFYVLLFFVILCCLFWIFFYTMQRIFQKNDQQNNNSMIPFLPAMFFSLLVFVFFGKSLLSRFYL